MPLTAAEVRNARPGEKAYKMGDSAGLYLFVTPAGARSWRLKYRYGGKEKLLTFGLFPDVGLADARERRDDARKLLRAKIDPGAIVAPELVALSKTFETVAREWHEAERPRWSPSTAVRIMNRFVADLFPDLGSKEVSAITGPDILAALRKIEKRGSIETAKRVRGYVHCVFERAIGEHLLPGDDPRNPAEKIGKALKPTPRGSKQPALVDVAALLALQRSVDRSTSGPAVKLASRLLALTIVRVGVLRAAKWDEFTGIDWDEPDAEARDAVWKIPAARMKLEVAEKSETAYDHDVPLPAQAVAILRAMRRLTGRCDFVFPSARSARRPMSDAALSSLYKRRGYRGRHVPHGWRAAFSTVMNERAVVLDREGDRLVIDLMLAHAPKGMSASEFAYNRAKYSSRRREIATVWADLICKGIDDPHDVLMGQVR